MLSFPGPWLCSVVCQDRGRQAQRCSPCRCYGKALKSLPDSAPLWHDLGLGLFHLGREQGAETETERRALMERSVRALKKSLTLDPNNHLHWTALGVVAASQCE